MYRNITKSLQFYLFRMMLSTMHHRQRSHMCGCPCWRSLSLSFFRSFNISSSNLFSPFTRGRGGGGDRTRHERHRESKTNSVVPLSKYQIRLFDPPASLLFKKRNSRQNSQIIVMYPRDKFLPLFVSFRFPSFQGCVSANSCVRPSLKGWKKNGEIRRITALRDAKQHEWTKWQVRRGRGTWRRKRRVERLRLSLSYVSIFQLTDPLSARAFD